MPKAILLSARECDLCVLDIPFVNEALTVMTEEIENASELLSKIQDASTLLEKTIQNCHYVDLSAHREAAAVRQSAHNLKSNLELAISDIMERIKSLVVVLDRKLIIPATLSTADDISVALYIAVRGPKIDWPLAELALERFLFLWTEEKEMAHDIFREDSNDFDSNLIKLFEGGNCWRVRKSLVIIQKIVDDTHDIPVSVDFFCSLASILLQPLRSFQEDEERKMTYLIIKNQNTAIDNGISRLIDSFLYSRKGKTAIAYNVLQIISSVIVNQNNDDNIENFSYSASIPKALIKTIIEEKENADVIEMCLKLLRKYQLNQGPCYDSAKYTDFIGNGICEALMFIMKTYTYDFDKMKIMIQTLLDITDNRHHIERFVGLGLVDSLVQLFNSPRDYEDLKELVYDLHDYDKDIFRKFYKLDIPEGWSKFFKDLHWY
jgi:hypothetical protein